MAPDQHGDRCHILASSPPFCILSLADHSPRQFGLSDVPDMFPAGQIAAKTPGHGIAGTTQGERCTLTAALAALARLSICR
jgi:hypothetical protein